MIKNYYSSKLPKLLGAKAFAIGNSIFYSMAKERVPYTMRRHEETHVKQYKVYGIVGFLVIYLFEYLRGRLKGLSHFEAYQDITFEIEARHNETLRR